MRHIISVLLENESGALSRVSGLFSARSFNIESLSVAPSEDVTTSRMTIVTSGNDSVIEQIVKQLDKLIDVIEVSEITSNEHIEREIAFVKINVDSIVGNSIQDIIKNLDPHSNYISKQELDLISDRMKGNFVGIGVSFLILSKKSSKTYFLTTSSLIK